MVMALEALSSNDILNFVIFDTISATPFGSHDSSEASFLLENKEPQGEDGLNHEFATIKHESGEAEGMNQRQKYNIGVQRRKKRKRKQKICKNKEEAETQRMTHIAVERNRRKLMNEHLAVLRSLMPESYVQRVCLLSFHSPLSFSLEYAWIFHNQLNKKKKKRLTVQKEHVVLLSGIVFKVIFIITYIYLSQIVYNRISLIQIVKYIIIKMIIQVIVRQNCKTSAVG